MAIALSQKFKQQQKLTLTPSLKKSIDLLQLSRYELINKIQQEIEENPFLEKLEDFEESSLLDNDFSYEIESKMDLKDNLMNQINDLSLDKESFNISKLIIENINEIGKLVESPKELEELVNFQYRAKK